MDASRDALFHLCNVQFDMRLKLQVLFLSILHLLLDGFFKLSHLSIVLALYLGEMHIALTFFSV